VLQSLSSKSDPASQSLCALAQHTLGQPSGLSTAQKLAEDNTSSEDPVVQIVAGTILASDVSTHPLALSLLQKHQGSLEAVLLLTHLHLSTNRTDLAAREVQTAKRWAQDSLLINLAEAWVNLRQGGSEKYQSAFYVYEELAQTDQFSSPTSLVGQAVSEMLLGRYEESQVGLENAMGKEGASAESVANAVVLANVTGKKEGREELEGKLRESEPLHPLLVGVREKSELFDEAAKKYSAKVATAA
jgi:coatomer subunit epsilon